VELAYPSFRDDIRDHFDGQRLRVVGRLERGG
jgi:hypothetical protein